MNIMQYCTLFQSKYGKHDNICQPKSQRYRAKRTMDFDAQKFNLP